MESLPLEILRYYISDYRDCAALRRTCKWYSTFTIHGVVQWCDWAGLVLNETAETTFTYLFLNLSSGRYMAMKGRDAGAVRTYLVLSSFVAAEYVLWLCCDNTKNIQVEILNLAAAKYTYYIASGAKTAVYIKTAELLARFYVPADQYHDLLW